MVSLAQHLGANQCLRLLGAETVEDADQLPFLARRIAVEDVDDDVGEIAAETFLYFLSAEADRLQDFAITERALRGNRFAQTAVVADQHSCAAVDGHRPAAIAAAEIVAAL